MIESDGSSLKRNPMPGRREMLERIRRALGRAPEGAAEVPPQLDLPPLGPVMPMIPSEDVLPKFESEWKKVGGSTYRVRSRAELEQTLRVILETAHTTGVSLTRNPLLAQLRLRDLLRAWGKPVALLPPPGAAMGKDESTTMREFASASFSAEVGITGVDFVLAETGSLVLSSGTEGSQLASLAPPVHVAFYRRAQVFASLDEVLEKLRDSRGPDALLPGRSVVFITGPSRTADIEQILVRGVHGPREVHAILVEEACLA